MTIRVLQVVEAFGKKADGVSGVLRLLSERLTGDLDISIVASSIDGDFTQLEYNLFQVYLSPGPIALRSASRTTKEICTIIEKTQPDIIHLHGVFSPLQRIMVRIAKKKGIWTILSPHGMLEPWLWDQKGWIYKQMKRVFWRAIIYPILSKADYIHAITRGEEKTLAKEFPYQPQIQIPNAIDLTTIKMLPINIEPQKTFIFLGRLHPKKGVDLLLQAFKEAQLNADWRLVIAGPDFSLSPTHGQELRQLAVDLGLAEKVNFTGPVYGDEKFVLLGKAWAVVVPSHSEVVALVNLEAAAVQTPTITTTGTGLYDWAESGGLLIEANIDQLTKALQSAASWTLKERLRRGVQARTFVQERYSWQVVKQRWIEAYQTIAH